MTEKYIYGMTIKMSNQLDSIIDKLDLIAELLKKEHEIEVMGLDWKTQESEDSANAR